MFTKTNFLDSASGARIAWHRVMAKTGERGIVLVSHGMSEHSRRYEAFAEYLACRGYHCYAWDHRGHGETMAPDAIQGQFARKGGASKVIEDVIAVRDMAIDEHPGLPVLLLGHSMGGYIALNTLISHGDKFAACAVWNSDFSIARSVPPLRLMLRLSAFFKGSDTPANMVARMTFDEWGRQIEGRRTMFDWLSNDPEEVDKYIADPLCGFICTVSLWRDLTDLILRGASTEEIANIPETMPFHLLAGGRDSASNYGKGIVWLARHLRGAGFRNVTKTIYPTARHETLNDVVRDQAMADFADWADSITQPALSQVAVPA